jgi:hypothetical protein
MLKLPTDKTIEVNGKTYNYTVPSSGRLEVETQAGTTKAKALVYSEFIKDSEVAHAIARKEGKRVETSKDGIYSKIV